MRYPQVEILRLLREAKRINKERVRMLNALAEGRLVLGVDDREKMLILEKALRDVVVDFDIAVAVKVVDLEEFTMIKPSTRLLEAYRCLSDAVYGSGTGESVSAGVLGKAPGVGRRGVTDSSKGEVRNGAKPVTLPRAAGVVNERAWEFKRDVDRRLRKVAADMEAFLAGGGSVDDDTRCASCGRIGQKNWKHCPRCGDRLPKGA